MAKKLPVHFYQQDTETVARLLLGQRLVRVFEDGTRVSGVIVETEAYVGAKDRACHGFNHRRTARTESLFLEGGHAYVYFIYGMHYCFNVVTRSTSEPEAVLIRALEPDEGLEVMRMRRKVRRDFDLTNGPGKLCLALGIDKSFDRLSLQSDVLFIEQTSLALRKAAAEALQSSPRIGVDYAGEAATWPLRFFVSGNPYVSKGFPQQVKTTVKKT